MVEAWEPDGREIAFIRRTPSKRSLDTIASDASAMKQIAKLASPGIYNLTGVDWSADGSKLAFDRFAGAECREKLAFRLRLTIASTADGSLRDIDALAGPRRRVALGEIEWSPDGARLLYLVYEFDRARGCGGHAGDFVTRLYVVDAGGATRRQLARDLSISDPVWSQDGHRIAYVDWNGRNIGCDLDVISPDGRGKRTLERNGPCDIDLAWEPRTSTLLVSRDERLDAVDTSSGRTRTLVRWNQALDNTAILGISTDGEWLAIATSSGSAFVRIALVSTAGGSQPVVYDVRRTSPQERLGSFSVWLG